MHEPEYHNVIPVLFFYVSSLSHTLTLLIMEVSTVTTLTTTALTTTTATLTPYFNLLLSFLNLFMVVHLLYLVEECF